MTTITIAGLDPALANFGLAIGQARVDEQGRLLDVGDFCFALIRTQKDQSKQVRVSSDSLARARFIHQELTEALQKLPPALIFAEIPHGGALSASAARSLGIATGIIASLPYPIVEVTPNEVKRLLSDRGPVSKGQVMEWAFGKWPHAPWLKRKGGAFLNTNEHLADAVATIAAGVKTEEFRRLASLFAHHEAARPDHNRPASDRSPRHRVPLGAIPLDQPADRGSRHRVRPDPR